MAGLLGEIFSAGNVAKRKLTDLLGNPLLSAQQFVGNINDKARNLNELTAAAAREGVDYGPASQQLGGLMAEGYNPVGMFIGPQSKLWNKQAAEMAKKMDGKFSPTEIWEKTGTFKGKDKKWRQETSDQGLLAKPVDEWSWSSRTENKAGQSTVGPVSEFVSHPKLEESYGGLIDFGDAERRLMMKVRPDETIAGSYSGDAIETGMTGQGVNRGTVAHELQHAIQAREGFAKGGSPEYMPELYREESDRLRAQARTMIDEAMAQDPLDPSKVLKPGLRARGLQMTKEAQNLEAQANRLDQFGGNFEEYRRLMGEVEAEATRKRLDMTDEERRLRAPWLDYEFPLDQLRVIMKNDNNMVVPRTSGLLGQ